MTTTICSVACPTCGRIRSIVAVRPAVAIHAARRPCMSCAAKTKRLSPRSPIGRSVRLEFADSLARIPSQEYRVDEDVVDWVVVDRLISGRHHAHWRTTTRAERLAAVAALTALGVPASTIADRMHVTRRTVERLRVAIRVAYATNQPLEATA